MGIHGPVAARFCQQVVWLTLGGAYRDSPVAGTREAATLLCSVACTHEASVVLPKMDRHLVLGPYQEDDAYCLNNNPASAPAVGGRVDPSIPDLNSNPAPTTVRGGRVDP